MPSLITQRIPRHSRRGGEAMREQIRQAMVALTAQHHRPPTQREIAAFLGGKSIGHISYHLREMRRRGQFLYTPRCARGTGLPLEEVSGHVQAAFEALQVEHTRLLAENARLRAQLASLQTRLERAS